jgi:splicing factor U2AF subunit
VYEDLYCELAKFGHLLELHVRLLFRLLLQMVLVSFPCSLKWLLLLTVQVYDNAGDHLIGNVYARFEWETEAQAAVDNLNDG